MTQRPARRDPGAPPGGSRRRTTALFCVWIVVLTLLFVRLIDLQVFRAGALQRLAIRQQLALLKLPGRRGLVVDRVGRPLAVNVEVDSVYAVPRAIGDPEAFAREVSPVVHLTPAEVVTRLRRGGPYFAWLVRRQPPSIAEAVRGLRLGDAIGILPESRRAYPAGSLAASVLGFAGLDDAGLAGLELQYDRALRATEGVEVADRDAVGRELVQTQRILTPVRDGNTLVLTLDEVIQHIAERELGQVMQKTDAQDGVAIVMDPRTGAILAMATLPSFDANQYQSASPALWKNRAISNVYEPGSTFKLFLAAAALSSRTVTLEDRFPDSGLIRINGSTIHDAERPAHASLLTLADIVTYSSNVGAAQVATRLGKIRFQQYIWEFDFGQPTGIDLPGEAAGIIRPVSQWLGPSLQNIAFGQGISVTPLQLLVAASAFGTRGLAVHPHLVAVIRDAAGHTLDTPGNIPPHRVVEPKVADQILAMMRGVVRVGTGTKAQLDGYAVAGKTGTAQRPSPTGGYEPGGYVSSFVGIVPAGAPRLAILVVVDRPHGVYLGGDVAAPVFREIARQALWYLRVPPGTGETGGEPGAGDIRR